jgi:tellurite resistance protein TerC
LAFSRKIRVTERGVARCESKPRFVAVAPVRRQYVTLKQWPVHGAFCPAYFALVTKAPARPFVTLPANALRALVDCNETKGLPMQSIAPLWLWFVFIGIVIAALVIDFVVLKKQGAHEVGVREALNWSVVWVALSFVFNGLFWWAIKDSTGDTGLANEKSLEFLTGYLIEKSLAVDNIFVFLMIFTYFAVPADFQKRVLMIGIIGAIVLRTVMILIGGWLLQQFHWVLYIFGAFLILTGIKMWWAAGKEPDLEANPALKLLRRIMPVSKNFDGEKFFTVENGKRIATPLFMVICLVGLTDVIFAVDSIPAIFAITSDPFIVLTSNVFAILGLRAMYFLLAAVASKFHLLTYGLAVILVFIGTKMMLIDVIKIPVFISLLVVAGILAVTVFWSIKTAPAAAKAASDKS